MITIERFLYKVKIVEGCWEWQGFKERDGYGTFRLEGKSLRAHRVSYELFKKSIPKGLIIHHKCRNTSCVNPDHLEAVTQAENIRIGLTGENNRKKTHCPHGHEYNENNTRITKKNQRICRICQKEWQQKWRDNHSR